MSIKIDNTGTTLANLRNAPKVSAGDASPVDDAPKSIGETPPRMVAQSELGALAALFAKGGTISKLRRRLNKLKKKKCDVTAARGTIACVDGNDLVYLGVEFLEEFQDQEDVIAGVMAHEWGHSCALKPTDEEMKELNWNQIFELRRSHEVLADEISGRMLALMGYQADRFVDFLLKTTGGTHNLKYHDSKTRADIVLGGYNDELRKKKLAQDLFPGGGYRNDYHWKLIHYDN